MPDDIIQMIKERKIIGSMLVNQIAGGAWKKHLKAKESNQKKQSEAESEAGTANKPKTLAEQRQSARDLGLGIEIRRKNAEKLVRAGVILTPGTDNYIGTAPEFRREPKPLWTEPGTGTLAAIEGYVEIGMTPLQAITAGTRNGAIACKMEKDLGTIEVGKVADVLVLDADPVANIANIRKLNRIVKDGRVIDPKTLPTNPVWYKPSHPQLTSEQPQK
jgi:imidazolonepropionase-like amidohydrolase